MELYIRIREEVTKLGVTQKKISEILEITPSTLAKYLNKNERDRRVIPYPVLIKMAEIFGVTLEYLLGIKERSQNFNYANIKTIKCDDGSILPIPFNASYPNMFAIKAKTNEMYPTIKIGDTLWCRHDKEKLFKENSIVHYSYQGKSVIRRVKIDEASESIVLVPDNLEKSGVLVITKENRDKVEISVVVGYSTVFDV